MGNNRIIFQNWIIESGKHGPSQSEAENSEKIDEAVKAAMKRLTEEEREFIAHFYFMGESYGEIAERSGREIHKLASLHERAIRKLRRHLIGFVRQRFDLAVETASECPLCQSAERNAIDHLIANRDRTATWKPVIRELERTYKIRVRSPQVIIGHEKYH